MGHLSVIRGITLRVSGAVRPRETAFFASKRLATGLGCRIRVYAAQCLCEREDWRPLLSLRSPRRKRIAEDLVIDLRHRDVVNQAQRVLDSYMIREFQIMADSIAPIAPDARPRSFFRHTLA